jgi:hypothetical protein
MSPMGSSQPGAQARASGAIFWLGLILVAAKALWGIWDRDLTFGDTSSYFLDAVRWSQSREINIVWSPLYTSYLGTVDGLFGDVRATVLIHRLVLVAATTFLAAWAARRFVSPGIAFLAALWWVVLPIHYDTLYEVHLFGALVGIGALAICSAHSTWRLPLLVAFYGIATVLVRNENVIVFAVLGAWLAFGAWRARRDAAGRATLRGLAVRVVILGALGLATLAWFHHLSYVKGWRHISEVSAPKHRLNMCQVYAFGHQQRHPEWTRSPWLDCQPLMKKVFGAEMPSITEMLAANPRATLEHFAWNLRLAPAGLQVLFLNATSATVNPDYAPVSRDKTYPLFLTAGLLALLAWGAVTIYRRRDRGWRLTGRDADFAVLVVANLLAALAVILTQRPRPSYLLGFAFICAVAYGRVIQAAWPRMPQMLDRALPVIVVVALLVVPSYRSLPLSSRDGRLSELYGLMKPHAPQLCAAGGPIAIGEYGYPLRNYLCRNYAPADVSLESMGTANMTAGQFVAMLDAKPVKVLVIDRIYMQYKTKVSDCAELDNALVARGWDRIVVSTDPASRFCDAAYSKASLAPVR